MMSLSRWKVGLVILATVLGLLFTLPNVLSLSRVALVAFARLLGRVLDRREGADDR